MRLLGTFAVCALLCACASTGPDAPLRLNDIQALASHNSYKRSIDAALFERMLTDAGPRMLALDYAHPSLAEQLDLGLLKLELDVFHDPDGGRYATPAGVALLRGLGAPAEPFDAEVMRAPGFKVLHIQDIDFRSQCATFRICLAQLRDWSDAHPGHLPIAVSINAKQQALTTFDAVEPLAFDADAWDALDGEIIEVLGRERLLVPDDVRGEASTLRRAVRRRGWPLLDEVRGRFYFVLDEPMPVLEGYLDGYPSLVGRAMFAIVPENHPAAAFLILNDPVGQAARIREAVEAGYIVRTRADADTREARTGDTTRRDAAFATGAQFVSTDYYRADPRFKTGYEVRFQGGATLRCNPVRRPDPACAPPAAVP